MLKFLVAFLLLTSAHAHAATPKKKKKPIPAPAPPPVVATPAPEPEPAPKTEIKWHFGAAADLQGQYFPTALYAPMEQKFGILSGEVNGTVKVGHGFLVKVRPTGHYDPNNPTKSEQSWWDVPEGYAQIKKEIGDNLALTLQAGMNTFTWGVTDGYNPVDVVSARRFSDPLNSEKLGAASLLARLDFGFLLLEGIYIPTQRKSVLPGENSRWLPRDLGGPITYSNTTTDLPQKPVFQFGDSFTYDNALRSNYGFRASSHIFGVDAAAYVFDGAASVPSVIPNLTLTTTQINASDPLNPVPTRFSAGQNIVLQDVYNRVTMTGASVVFGVWELVCRLEGAVTKAYRLGSPAITEKDTEAVGELEHTFSGEKSTFTLIGLVTWANPQDNGLQTTSSPTLTRVFDQADGLGFRWAPMEAIAAEGYGVLDGKHGGTLVHGQVTYKLNDAWKIYGGGQVFSGNSSQPIGVYGKNSRIFGGLKVSI